MADVSGSKSRFSPIVSLASLVVSLVALLLSWQFFVATEQAEGPIIDIAGDGAWYATQEKDGEVYAVTRQIGTLLLVNKGRTPVDVVEVVPKYEDGLGFKKTVMHSKEHCEEQGYVTIEPGGTALVITTAEFDEYFENAPMYWDVQLATGERPIQITRPEWMRESGSGNLLKAYGEDIKDFLRACSPESFSVDWTLDH